MAKPIPPVAYEVMVFLRNVKTLEEHDSKLDDLAELAQTPQPELMDRKRTFRNMVKQITDQTNCPEEEAVKEVANFIYGRVLDGIPVDGQTRHG